MPLQDVLDSGFVGGGNPELVPGSFLFNADNILWQNSLLQPIGGMDRIWQQLLIQRVPVGAVERQGPDDPRWPELSRRQERYVGDLVLLNHPVTSIVSGSNGVRIVAKGQPRSVDFCISTMAPKLLLNTLPANPNDQPLTKLRNALEAADPMVPAIKVGWQAKNRFWEKENHIYGGISWIDEQMGQIWYPSEDFNASTGVLTGAYNRGPAATSFGQLTQAKRLEAALSGGEKLHPRSADGRFPGYRDSVYRGVTIAWQYMPFQQGGWAPVIATRQPEIYKTMVTPLRRLYVAGDTYSYLPGWLEGAVTSADKAVEAIGCA